MTDTPFTLAVDEGRGVANIELGRPATGNKLTAGEVAELGRTIKAAGANKAVKVVVVRAKGDAFCMGRAPNAGAPPANALGIRTHVTDQILSLYADVRACEVPVVAVVQGPAVGFGSAFVGVADLAIASDAARFSFNEMDHNLPPTLAISAVLDKMPLKHIMHMVMTRVELDPATALAYGLISQATTAAKLEETVQATLARMLDRDRASLCAVKEYMVNAPKLDHGAAARLGANLLSVILASQAKH